MTQKTKNYFKLALLFISISIVFYNCDKEEIITEQQSNIETVSVSEALNLFSQSSKLNKTSKTNSNPFAIPNLDKISQEEIINSNELLTIIPAFTYQGVHSRVLLVKIDGEIKSVVFSMVKDESSNTEEFSGMIYIHTLQKEYVNTFKVENGIPVSRFKKPTSTTSSKSSFAKGDKDCVGIACGMRGEEVIIIAKKDTKFDFISIFWGGGGNPDEGGQSWDYTGDSSGGDPTGGGQDPAETTCDPGYVKDSNGVCVEDNFIEGCSFGYIKDDDGNCVVNPVLSADCRSFEYAQPPGALVKACAVTGLFNLFVAYGTQNGKVGHFEAFVGYPLVFFTVPPTMSNGYAANRTANAVTEAFDSTTLWFAANPNATKEQVGNKLSSYILKEMAKFGGSMSQVPPFNIPSPAPYIASLTGTGNCL